MASNGVYLGINAEPVDPSAAVVQGGKVLAFAEEERFIRNKHAIGVYPLKALEYCLKAARISMSDIDSAAVAWDIAGYSDGSLRAFYDSLAEKWPVDKSTKSWQNYMIGAHNREGIKNVHYKKNWHRIFGDIKLPEVHSVPHHYTHAFQAYMQSGFDQAITLSIDGSGDKHCTVVWRCENGKIEPMREFLMPHSLGWLYSAITEFLGFQSKDGEYKVMGLAAYGESDKDIFTKLEKIIRPTEDGIGYELEPRYIHYGSHSYSGRFTNTLVKLLGRPPRAPHEEITAWHRNLAYAVQKKLEETVSRLVLWAIRETGIQNVCLGGGVAHNIKMNSTIFHLPEVKGFFAHPLCSDLGTSAGAALALCYRETGSRPGKLETLALGPQFSDEEIEETLNQTSIPYEKFDDITIPVVKELARGAIVGWFQGRMEAGPRALGQRSILADPRDARARDKVNAVIKYREYWRPFCPSLPLDAMPRYFDNFQEAPFMNIAFAANEQLQRQAPAIVHVDGTVRVQTMRPDQNPLFYRLLKNFEKATGVPVLLNTSFNIKGEPVVCSVQDALRTFWATGLDVLAIGSFFINKHKS